MTENLFSPKKGELLSDPENFDRDAYHRVKKTYCGLHSPKDVRLIDIMEAYGEKRIIKLPSTNGERFEYCHECLAKMTRRCVFTNKAIFVGDIVTAKYIQGPYAKLFDFFKKKEAAAYLFRNPNFIPAFTGLIQEASRIKEVIFEVVVTLQDDKEAENQGFYLQPGIFVPKTITLYSGMTYHEIRQKFIQPSDFHK